MLTDHMEFKPLRVHPDGWLPPDADRPPSGFRATYEATLAELDHEARQIDATDLLLQVDVADGQRRVSGMIRADAVARHPGVVLAVVTPEFGTLTYSTDRFPRWQHNLRAIVLTLFDLRRMERYGTASRGQQYAGWGQLGTGLAMDSGMTVGDARRLLEAAARDGGREVTAAELTGREGIEAAYAAAAFAAHPDHGGTDEAFVQITAARDLLLAQLLA